MYAFALLLAVTGVVQDETGGLVAGARVLLMDQDYVKLAETKSSETGTFSFPEVKPGLHFVQVKQPKFMLCQQHVEVRPAGEHHLYMVLRVARGLEQVEIKGDPIPGAEASKAAVAALRAGGRVEGYKRIAGRWPAFPDAARNRAASGTVTLYYTIRSDGAVADIVPLSPGDPDLEKASVDAVSAWRYEPMKLNGVPVETNNIIVFTFRYH
jgi:TonB family protein